MKATVFNLISFWKNDTIMKIQYINIIFSAKVLLLSDISI